MLGGLVDKAGRVVDDVVVVLGVCVPLGREANGDPMIDIGLPVLVLPGKPVFARGFDGLVGLPLEAALAGLARFVLIARLGGTVP